MTAPINIAATPVYRGVPPERWQEAASAYRRWWSRHSDLSSALNLVVRGAYALMILLLIAALMTVPRLAYAVVPAAFMTVCLMVVALLARTRTIGWRSVILMYGVGAAWSLIVAMIMSAVRTRAGLSVMGNGMSIALTIALDVLSPLVPLVLVVFLAPGRMRRLAASDWALLGFAAGAGLTAVKDGIRALEENGLLSSVLGNGRLPFSFNPWTSGSMTQEGSNVLAVSNQVSTASITMAVAVAITLWRLKDSPAFEGAKNLVWLRVVAWILPALVILQSVSDHATYIARIAQHLGQSDSGGGFPALLMFLWRVNGGGLSAIPLSVILMAACLLLDAHRRAYAGVHGWTVAGAPAPRYPNLTEAPPFVRALIVSVVALANFTWGDLAVTWGAYGDLRQGRLYAMRAGRATAEQVRGVRADAMEATTPGAEPNARQGFRLGILVVSVVLFLLCCMYEVRTVWQLAPELKDTEDDLFLSALPRMFSQWWSSLNGTQGLLCAIGVLAAAAMSLSLILTLGSPRRRISTAPSSTGLMSYLITLTPGQAALALLDFAMTYMPRSALSASPAGGGTDLAAELSVNRRIRAAESFSESQDLFTARTKRQVAVEADIARLQKLAESLGVVGVDALEPSRIDETVADLAASGADSRVVGEMRDLAASVAEQQAEILEISRRLNTSNGEQFAILEGFRITDAFRGGAIDQRPVDSPVHALALSPSGAQLVVIEYQGAAPTIDDDDETDIPPRRLPGRAAHKSADNVLEHLASDERVTRFFRETPELWQSLKEGRTSLEANVLYTPIPGMTYRAGSAVLAVTPELVESMDTAISALSGADAPAR